MLCERPFVNSRATELPKKVCPRLRDPASDGGGEFTHPRTHFFGQLCRAVILDNLSCVLSYHVTIRELL